MKKITLLSILIFVSTLIPSMGQVVRRNPGERGESLRVEGEGLSAGIYFLNITNDAGNFGTVKLLLQE